MHNIQISDGIKLNQPTQRLTLIIYNQYQLPAACDLVGYPLDLQHNFLLIMKDGHKGGIQFYIAVKVGDKVTRQEQMSIGKLIAICTRAICIDLNQQLQSKIQRLFLSVIPELHARFAENKKWVERPSICFVNESYRKTYSRQTEGIYYYRNTSELMAGILLIQTLKVTSLTKKLGLFNLNNDQPIQEREPALTMTQLLNIYYDKSLAQKDAAHIKYAILNYKEDIWMNKKKQKAEQLIFEEGAEDSNKKVLREIKKIGLSKKQMNKLQWKYARLKRFKTLIEQQKVNKSLVRQYKNMVVWDLTPQIIVLEIKQFYRVWIRNTLKQLQILFNSIANRRDSKALGEFRTKCSKAIQIMNNSQMQCQAAHRSQILQKMKNQIQQFIDAHERIIENQYLSVVKYIAYKCKFMWRNQPKIYHKAAFFFLILFLAWLQKNVIIGITLISLGLIFLAINI